MFCTSKDRAVNAITARFFARYRGPNHLQACLYWANETATFLRSKGRQAVLQAGTALFRRVPLEQCGVSTESHYGYVWREDAEATVIAVCQNKMPEMHVWAADHGSQEIIDLTLGFQKHLCEKAGIEWLCEDPPQYLWAQTVEIDDLTIVYQPSLSACILANVMLSASPDGRVVSLNHGDIFRRWTEQVKAHKHAA